MPEPLPQLQPVNPRPEGLPYAEPKRTLDLKPAPKQPLDLRYDYPKTPQQEALDMAKRPLGWTEPIVNNPLNYAPMKALSAPLAIAERSMDLHNDLSTPDEIEGLGFSELPLPNEFLIDSIIPNESGETIEPGSDPNAYYTVRYTVIKTYNARGDTQEYPGSSSIINVPFVDGKGYKGPIIFKGRNEYPASHPSGTSKAVNYPISTGNGDGYGNLLGASTRYVGWNMFGSYSDYRIEDFTIYKNGEEDKGSQVQRTPSPARNLNASPVIQGIPLAFPNVYPQGNPFAEPETSPDYSDVPEEFMTPRRDPLTGEIQPEKQPIPYWELPDDEWLITPSPAFDFGNGKDLDEDDDLPKAPPLFIPLDGFTPDLVQPIIPSIRIPTVRQFPPLYDPSDCPPCNCCEDSKAEDVFGGELNLPDCGDEFDVEKVIEYSEDTGLKGIAIKIDLLQRGLEAIWDKLRCETECELAMPESYAIRTSVQVPQVVVVIKKTGDKSSTRWNFSIPHFKFKTEKSAESTPLNNLKWVRGNTMLTVQLPDNSHIILNVKDEGEAERLWGVLQKCLDPLIAANAYPKITKGIKRTIQEVEVTPTLLKYYSTGEKTMVPDWVVAVNR
jgi:hypothetical protein